MQVPENKADRPIRFRGILRSIELVDSPGRGDIKPSKQIKITIEPTSYVGSQRNEWYRLTDHADSKYQKFLSRLADLNLFRDGSILDDECVNREWEFEVVDFPVSWPPAKCKDCSAEFHKAREAQEHRKTTGHKANAGFILPLSQVNSNVVGQQKVTSLSVEDEILSVVRSNPNGVEKQRLFEALESKGHKRSDAVPILVRMTRGNRLSEKDGKIFTA